MARSKAKGAALPPPAYAHALRAHETVCDSPLVSESADDPGLAQQQSYSGLHNLIMLLLFVNNLRLVVENYLKYGLLLTLPGTHVSATDVYHVLLSFGIIGVHAAVSWWIERCARPVLVDGASTTTFDEMPVVADRVTTRRNSSRPSSATGTASGTTSSASVTGTITQRRTRRTSSSASESGTETPATVEDSTQTYGKYVYRYANSHVFIAHAVNIIATLTFANFYATAHLHHPFLILFPCTTTLILSLKMASWMFVNYDLRRAAIDDKPITDYGMDVVYPRNVTLPNYLYFCVAPTLCYQPSYPRNPRFRRLFFAKRLLEFVTLLGVMYFLIEQYVRPTLYNSLRPFHVVNIPALFERILKLSIPSLYFWLIMFYSVFHSSLNLLGEILRFGDRTFYMAWWNAKTIGQYWRLWNLPVYRWFKRHVYVPLITKHGCQPWVAGIAAFFISAIGHEIIVGVPTRIIQGWAFAGMMGQLPLIWATEFVYGLEIKWYKKRQRQLLDKQAQEQRDQTLDGSVPDESVNLSRGPIPRASSAPPIEVPRSVGNIGNYVFWLSFCILGQPLSVLLYYRAWFMREYPEIVAQAVNRAAGL